MGSPVLWAAGAVKFLQNAILSPLGFTLTLPSATGTLATTADTATKQASLKVAYLKDVKVTNTAGGGFTQAAWQTRDLNDEVDTGSIVALSGNAFTPVSGTYIIRVWAPAFRCARHKARLYNVTTTTQVLLGLDAYGEPTTGQAQTYSVILGTFTANGTDSYRIEHWCTTTRATDGYGIQTNISGVSEVYTQVELVKIS